MGRRKHHDRITAIQGEQVKLVKIQRELEALLEKVNETVNALKVEELQLKSNVVAEMKIDQSAFQSPTSNVFIPEENTISNLQEIEKHVNQQQIDLDMFILPHNAFQVEIEEEDSEYH